MMNTSRRVGLIMGLLACVLASVPASAQNTSAALSGRVTDAAGNPVAGATVEIVHLPSSTAKTAATGADGRYNARGLRVGGPFTIRVSKADSKTAEKQDIYLALAEDTTIDVQLESSAAALEAVKVTANAQSLVFQSDNKGLGSNLTQRDLQTLPNSARSIQDVVRYDPQVTITNKARGEISALGQNSRYNNITVDGVPTNDSFGLEPNGLPALAQPLSFDAIEEYNISTANYDVTTKRAVGANINIVTKSGTNDFHGSVYYAFKDAEHLTGDDRNGNTFTGFDRQWTSGIDLGGPIVKDTLFFFLNYEEAKAIAPGPDFGPIGSGRGNIVNISQDDLNRIIQIAQGYGLIPGNLNSASANQDNKTGLVKLDWNINEQHRASLRYNETKSDQPILGGFGTNSLALSSFWYTQHRDFKNTVLNLYDDWNAAFSTESSVAYSKYFATPQVLAQQPQVNVALGPDNSSTSVNLGEEQFRDYNILQVKTYTAFFAGTWTQGGHALKAGFDFQRDDFFNLFGRTEFGAYNFASIDDFASGNYSSFNLFRPTNGDINSIAANWGLNQHGLFVQDTWQAGPNFSLQYGIRWDIPKTGDRPLFNPCFASAPGAVADNCPRGGFGYTNQGTIDGNSVIEPRVAFNYAFESERLTQLRGGIGISEGITPGVWLSNPFTNNGVVLQTFFAQNGCCFSADPHAQQPPNTAPSAQQAVDTVDPNFQLPTVLKVSLGFDRELPWWGTIVSAEFAHVGTIDGIQYESLNLGPGNGTLPDGRMSFWSSTDPSNFSNPARPTATSRSGNNASFSDVTLLTNTNKGKSDSLTVLVKRPLADDWSASVGGILGHSTEVNPGTSSQATSNFSSRATFNPNEDIAARSNYDIRERFLATLTWQHHFFDDYITSAAAFFDGHTGQPYSWVFANDANGDRISNNDLAYIPRQGGVEFVSGTPDSVIQEFYNFIQHDPYLSARQGQVARRNGADSSWVNQLDLGFRQEIPGLFTGNKGEIRFDFFNFGNLLNKKWGDVQDVTFFSAGGYSRSLASFAGVDPANGQYVYSLPTRNGHYNPQALTLENSTAQSVWSVLVTVRYTF